jgi:hypothetical protein
MTPWERRSWWSSARWWMRLAVRRPDLVAFRIGGGRIEHTAHDLASMAAYEASQ